MAPPKQHNIDPAEILQAVFDATYGKQKRIDGQLSRLSYGEDFWTVQRLHQQRRAAEWARYSFYELISQRLTDAERRAYQRVVVELERQGLVAIDGRHIQLTAKGKRRLRESLKAATGSNSTTGDQSSGGLLRQKCESI